MKILGKMMDVFKDLDVEGCGVLGCVIVVFWVIMMDTVEGRQVEFLFFVSLLSRCFVFIFIYYNLRKILFENNNFIDLDKRYIVFLDCLFFIWMLVIMEIFEFVNVIKFDYGYFKGFFF